MSVVEQRPIATVAKMHASKYKRYETVPALLEDIR